MKRILFIVVILIIFLAGCEKEADITDNFEYANFEVTNTTTGMTSYGCPYVKITVKNVGSKTGYNVSCTVKAFNGNTIIDTGFAYFADGSDIDPGESAIDDAIFFDLSSHNQYDRLEYDLDWLEH